jgi:hypothetical protein
MYANKRVLIFFLILVLGGSHPFVSRGQNPVLPADSLPKGASRDSAQTHINSSERLLNNLKQLSKRKTLIGRGLDALFDFDEKRPVRGINPELISNAYEKHNYKVVRNIHFKRLNSFGFSISDTARAPRSFFEKAGNSLHTRTQKAQVRSMLLFERGEALEPLALSESERLLRQTSYILDARVLVNENTTTQDSVDIIVVTKDIFSISGSAAFNTNSGAGRIGLNDLNFLGMGHEFRNVYQFGLDSLRRSWTYSGSYSVDNISNTFISGQVIYRNEIHTQHRGINFYRDFYTINTKHAGALSVNWYSNPILYQTTDGTTQRMNLNFLRQDYWFGRAFRLKSYDLGYESRSRIITAGRILSHNYENAPNADYQNSTLYMAGVGFSYRKYYRDQYLFGFGRTEDIPVGSLLSFSAGYEDGALYNRRFVGAKLAFARYRTDFGYLYFDAQFDTYLRSRGHWEQGELSSEILYFTKLLSIGTWQWRHFFWNRTTLGINRKFGENLLSINRSDGVRGFSGPERGTRRVAFNYESSLFTPVSFLGFRLALVNFIDIAWLSDGNHANPFDYRPYQGYGIGIRFRNEYMSISTIQLLIGFYPQGGAPFKTYHSTRPYYDFNDFRFTQPIISDFR